MRRANSTRSCLDVSVRVIQNLERQASEGGSKVRRTLTTLHASQRCSSLAS
jgi:hypothetical protein